MKVFTVSGELVKTVLSQRVYEAGLHQEVWEANNKEGASCARGVYILLLEVQRGEKRIVKTHKIAVLNR